MKKVLAFDIGGTKIAYAIINNNGEFETQIKKNSTPKTCDEIVTLLKNVIRESYDVVDGVAIATAGAINKEGTKITSHVGNLPAGYNQIDFTSLTDKPILLENDANSAAWAEFILGAAKGCNDAIVLTLGTGVGSGIIVDGKLLKGKSGAAGEMHFPIDCVDARQCTCGLKGCFEAYASGTGLNKNAVLFMGEGKTSYDVIDGIKNGNTKAREAFDKWQNDLTCGLIMLANVFDPEKIILSGSMAKFVEYETINKKVNNAILAQPFKLEEAKFENNAGMIGAALLLFDKNA